MTFGSATVLVLLAGAAPSLFAQQTKSVSSNAGELPDAPGYGASIGMNRDTGEQAAAPGRAGPDAPSTIEGTVTNTNGGVVEGARVVLSGEKPGDQRVVESGSNGQFAFSGLPAGTFRLTVSAPGMGKVVSPQIILSAGQTRFLPALVMQVSAGITEVRVVGNQREIEEEEAEEDMHIEESQRVLGVIPNFYSSFDWNAPPLDAKQKFKLAFRSEIDPITFAGAAAIAGGEEYKGIYPGYGTGFSGFGKRFAAQYANDLDSRMIGSALLPSLFHQDPRYFYKGTGTIRSRALYAIKSAVICRGDNGKPEFDFSHIGGDFAAGTMSNLYYPESNEGPSLVFINGLIEIAGQAGTNLVREFVLRGLTTHVPASSAGKP
ncbi:MAG: carboxypeptidase-like regulatory domain-containing protein [Acidobacteriaceae bacterium]